LSRTFFLAGTGSAGFPGNANLLIGAVRDANREIGVPGFYHTESGTGFPAISNFNEVLAQRTDDLFPAAVQDIFLKFLEGDVHNVVVMELLGRDFVAEFEPDAVEQIDFLGRKPRGVRTKIENFFLAVR
jgi:hypothetical protein